MSQYFWSHAEPRSKIIIKFGMLHNPPLMGNFSIDGDTRLFAQEELRAIAGHYLCTDTKKVSSLSLHFPTTSFEYYVEF